MIINSLDLGPASPNLSNAPLQTNAWAKPGQQVGTVLVLGSREIPWPQGAKKRSRQETVYVEAPSAIGGQAAGSAGALRYLVRQLQELAGNREMNPAYIQWRSGAGVLVSDPDDGWWIVEDVSPDMSTEGSGWAAVQITASFVAPPPPAQLAYGYVTAALGTNFAGTNAAAQTALGFPLNATYPAPVLSRIGGEGTTPVLGFANSVAPVNPLAFVPSGTIADWWKGGCHVYDTLNTSSNPVPVTGGTFAHANWVEVFSPDHAFLGDCVATNGFLLLLFQAGTTNLCSLYLWNTALGTPTWQLLGTLVQATVSGTLWTNQGYRPLRSGMEEVAISASMAGSESGHAGSAQHLIRLQRGSYFARVAETRLVANITNDMLQFVGASSGKMVAFNPSAVNDASLDLSSGNAILVTTNSAGLGYGYAGAVFPASATPYAVGFLYQNLPLGHQPGLPLAPTDTMVLGDTPGAGATNNYGVFAAPIASAANLQAEAELGTLGVGWSNVTDTNASNGRAAKQASGTAAFKNCTFGTAWVPTAGTYTVWFRLRVTSAAGSSVEMQIGLWDATASAWIGTPLNLRPNQAATTYAWYQGPAAIVTPTASHNMQFQAQNQATLGTDWWVDEAVLIPVTLTGLQNGPQDLFQQFLGDFSARLIRL